MLHLDNVITSWIQSTNIRKRVFQQGHSSNYAPFCLLALQERLPHDTTWRKDNVFRMIPPQLDIMKPLSRHLRLVIQSEQKGKAIRFRSHYGSRECREL